jgi:SAM-dependent methyltransferase
VSDRRLYAAAVARNREPLLDVLARVLPARGRVLEIASGSGEHAVFFAAALAGITWQPSDVDAGALASIEAWIRAEAPSNVLPPLRLDATDDPWPVGSVDAVFCANMIHIAPWEACLGLLRGVGSQLAPDGVLVLYGPYAVGGRHTAPSNAAFDADLRRRDPAWGVRDLDAVAAAAAAQGLVLAERVPMPANNQTLVFRRSGADRDASMRPE